ncbi:MULTISPECIES: DUF4350 domain-containing protein [Halorussus]|uniref:DUF4350 domain-containing protein n=1 Tax=Halorussus TaxID=1070314 RepID=UPI000E21362E|nr:MULTISPECIES: DUF4350 domain-containing protein [Halorussus]NHN59482.1 hypothetical protein [Halorussus sp. JP-T4]
MQRTDLLKGVGAFALIAVVVIGSTVAVGTLTGGPTDASAAPNATAFTSESLQATPVADDGTVAVPDAGESKTVVVDRSHANAVEKGQIQPLVDALIAGGHDVRFHSGAGQSYSALSAGSSGSSLNATLRSADAFVVMNPGSAYSESEIDAIEAFAEAGGRVLVLADPVGSSGSSGTSLPLIGSSSTSSVTPGQPTNLAARFDVSFDTGYLYDMADNANHFQSVYVNGTGSDPLTAGTDRVVLRRAAALTLGPEATPLFEAESTRLSATRREGDHAVAARNGNLTAVGDTDFLAPASATVADNDAFVGNLASFLVTGEKRSGVPAAGGSTGAGTSTRYGGGLPTQTGDASGNSTST